MLAGLNLLYKSTHVKTVTDFDAAIAYALESGKFTGTAAELSDFVLQTKRLHAQ